MLDRLEIEEQKNQKVHQLAFEMCSSDQNSVDTQMSRKGHGSGKISPNVYNSQLPDRQVVGNAMNLMDLNNKALYGWNFWDETGR